MELINNKKVAVVGKSDAKLRSMDIEWVIVKFKPKLNCEQF